MIEEADGNNDGVHSKVIFELKGLEKELREHEKEAFWSSDTPKILSV